MSDSANIAEAQSAFLREMRESQERFLRQLDDRAEKADERIDSITLELKAVGKILSARLDDIERTLGGKLDEHGGKLDKLSDEAITIARGVNEHTRQISEILRLANSAVDMAGATLAAINPRPSAENAETEAAGSARLKETR